MTTYQDLVAAQAAPSFLRQCVDDWKSTIMYSDACDADEYGRMHNIGIRELVQFLFNADGTTRPDPTAANCRIPSNFFRQLNVQRNNYSLGNGLTFPDASIKDKLGADFDSAIKTAGYNALTQGLCLCYWNYDRMIPMAIADPKRNGGTVPFWDEENGNLGAALRFWQLTKDKPLYMTLFEPDGVTKYVVTQGGIQIKDAKRAYVQTTKYIPINSQTIVVGEENYSALPVVPLWGSELKQSTLVGMRAAIDAYDIVMSGFANNLQECSEIYWILNNADGMDDEELGRFRQNLLYRHIANVDADNGVDIKPYTQDVPTTARTEFLKECRAHIYESFGGLDVHTVAAGATNDHIDAAYQPLDDNADDYEYQIIECVQQLLALQGIEGGDAIPTFKRNRISNTMEQTQMVMLAANYLDDETLLSKLPFISPDEIEKILERKDEDDFEKVDVMNEPNNTQDEQEEDNDGNAE